MNWEMFGYASFLLMGVTLGILGAGGAILAVPILVYSFHVEPLLATVQSLLIVGISASVGGLASVRSGGVDFRSAWVFGIPALVGLFFSRQILLPALPPILFQSDQFTLEKPVVIMTAFSLVMLSSARSMLKTKRESKGTSPQSTVKVIFTGATIGSVAGFVGAGGGFLIVPALANQLGLPMVKAVGTALVIVGVNSFMGFLGDVTRYQDQLHLPFLTLVVGLSSLGIVVGRLISQRIPEKRLKQIFGVFVLVVGTAIFIDQWMRVLAG